MTISLDAFRSEALAFCEANCDRRVEEAAFVMGNIVGDILGERVLGVPKDPSHQA